MVRQSVCRIEGLPLFQIALSDDTKRESRPGLTVDIPWRNSNKLTDIFSVLLEIHSLV